MTDIAITFNVEGLVRELRDTGRRQMPFALANALNATADDIQQAARNAIVGSRSFTFRTGSSRQFVLRQVRRNRGEDFATKRSPVARVRLANNGRTSLLSLIEEGGTRQSRFVLDTREQKNVPVPARAVPTDTVPRTLYPRKLDLRATGQQVKGARRTFAVRTAAGDTLVLQRQGKAKVRTLFVLQRQVQVPAKRFFAPVAERTALTRFDTNLERALRRALETAR